MDLFSTDAYIEHVRNNCRQLLVFILDEGPGGPGYNEEHFDLEQYKSHVEALRVEHAIAKISLAGLASESEESWEWGRLQFATYFMSPINMTRLAEQFREYMKGRQAIVAA